MKKKITSSMEYNSKGLKALIQKFIDKKIFSSGKSMTLLLTLFVLTISIKANAGIGQRGTATSATTTNTTLTINKPSGVVAGDIMIVNITQTGNTATNASRTGWTLIAGSLQGTGAPRRSTILYRKADGTEGGSFAFTLGTGTSSGVGSIIAFSGVDASVFDVTPGSLNTYTGVGTTVTATGITTVTNGSVIVFLAGAGGTSADVYSGWSGTTPTLTEIMDFSYSSVTNSIGAAWGTLATAGGTGNKTATLDANYYWAGILIALKPDVSPGSTQTETFTSSGTFTVPNCVTSLTVEAWGGGGGGTNASSSGRGGGGGGAYTRGIITGLSVGPLSVIVGVAGVAGAGGGASSVSTVVANGGSSNASSNTGGTGGAASAITGFVVASYVGGKGGNGSTGNNNDAGGGGGGSAFTNSVGGNGTNGTNSNTTGGAGGLGTGDGGDGAAADNNPTPQAGSVPGGGGGGRGEDSGTSASGASGQVIITYTLPNNPTITIGSNPTICLGTASANLTYSATTGCPNKYSINFPSGLPNANVTGNNLTGSPIVINTSGASAGTYSGTLTVENSSYGFVSSTYTISVTINPILTPSVTTSITTGTNPTCSGTSITFTATPTNGGTPTYQWTKNGSNISGATSVTYTGVAGTAFVNGDLIRVVMTSTATCASPTTATSLPITMTVNTLSTAPTGISGTLNICSGSSTTLTLTGGSAGTGAVAQWYAVSCGAVPGGTGPSITVSPSSTTTYYVLYTGTCNTTTCASATVTIDSTTSTNGGVSWSNGTPSATKSVVFDGSSATIGADFTGCSLTLINSATVSVTSGFDVTLNGALIISSGTFTLNNNANLIQNNSNYTNSGNIIVNRNSSLLKRLDYTLWSSPVTGQGLYAFSKFTLPNRFYTYTTSSNSYSNSVGFSLTGLQYPSPLISPNGVDGIDDANVPFTNGIGYLIRVPYNHPTTPAVYNGVFTGVANNGDISPTVSTAANGYNAVGNPYPSRLSVPDFIDGNSNITGPLYFWRKTNNSSSDSYATLTKTAYVANGYPGGDTGTGFFNTGNEANWAINIGQGFIVKATSGSTITFTNSMRRSSNANQFFRTSSQTANTAGNGLYWLNLTDNSGVYSQMAVGYSAEGTMGFDRGIDGENINKEFYLTSLIGADEYSIQGRSDFDSSDIVPLSYKALTSGTYSITIDHANGLFTDASQPIYLKDNLTNTINNLNTAAYSFASDAGTFTDRFEIVYQTQLSNTTFTANTVVIYNQNNDFVVNSGNAIMAFIKVFDVRGRLIEEKTKINSNQTTIKGGLANQVLLVQITSEDGIVVTKKVIR